MQPIKGENSTVSDQEHESRTRGGLAVANGPESDSSDDSSSESEDSESDDWEDSDDDEEPAAYQHTEIIEGIDALLEELGEMGMNCTQEGTKSIQMYYETKSGGNATDKVPEDKIVVSSRYRCTSRST